MRSLQNGNRGHQMFKCGYCEQVKEEEVPYGLPPFRKLEYPEAVSIKSWRSHFIEPRDGRVQSMQISSVNHVLFR